MCEISVQKLSAYFFSLWSIGFRKFTTVLFFVLNIFFRVKICANFISSLCVRFCQKFSRKDFKLPMRVGSIARHIFFLPVFFWICQIRVLFVLSIPCILYIVKQFYWLLKVPNGTPSAHHATNRKTRKLVSVCSLECVLCPKEPVLFFE